MWCGVVMGPVIKVPVVLCAQRPLTISPSGQCSQRAQASSTAEQLRPLSVQHVPNFDGVLLVVTGPDRFQPYPNTYSMFLGQRDLGLNCGFTILRGRWTAECQDGVLWPRPQSGKHHLHSSFCRENIQTNCEDRQERRMWIFLSGQKLFVWKKSKLLLTLNFSKIFLTLSWAISVLPQYTVCIKLPVLSKCSELLSFPPELFEAKHNTTSFPKPSLILPLRRRKMEVDSKLSLL